MGQRQVELIGAVRFPGSHFACNLLIRRNLLAQFVRRDFAQRFVGSVGGWLWGVIHPLVFQFCLKIRLEPQQNYTLFVFSGFLPWLLFEETVQGAATCVVHNSGLIKKTVFPAEFMPTSALLSSMVHHLISTVLAVVVIGIVLKRCSFTLAVLPLYTTLLGMFSLGIGWVASGLEVYLRDTKQILSVVLTFWFWLTPILVNENQIPARFRFVFTMNPLAYSVFIYRELLLWGRAPTLNESVVFASYALTTFVCGGMFFRHLKQGFADVL